MSSWIRASGTPNTLAGGQPSTRLRPAWPTWRSPKATAGAAILVAVVLLALLSDWIAPFAPTQMHPADRFAPPGGRYLLGTDFFGRDLWSRILAGYRTSLAIASLAVGFALTVGGTLGVAAGYAGGRVDTLIMRSMDCLLYTSDAADE